MSTPFYDLASLVVVPSGYKSGKVYAQKPLTTDGQLTFTRASSATRVASNGLIEKVRTNLVTYSNTFSDASWTSAAGTKPTTTQNVTDPFGVASNAWTITGVGTALSRLGRTGIVLSTAPQTLSFFVKKGTATSVTIYTSQTSVAELVFNFDTQAITGTNGVYNVIRKATALTNGWFRLSMTLSTVAATSNETWGFSLDGSITTTFLLFGGMLENGDIATDYIPTTTAAVSVGPVSGLPRLDYLNSTCPKLLLEPQRSSLTNFSEQFDNAYWSKVGTTILANNTTSPDGYISADRLSSNGGGADQYLEKSGFSTTAGTYTSSVFVKNVNATISLLMAVHIGEGSVTSQMNYNWATGAVTMNGTNAVSAKATSYGNGWVRLEFTYTIGALVTGHWFRTYVQTGVSTNSIFIYGAQVELGAYATSYIPTLAASVTRVADAASKTGISSLIGQTEGTWFAEIVRTTSTGNDSFWLNISDNSSNNWIFMGSDGVSGRFYLRASSTTIIDQYPSLSLGRHKLAIAYKSGSIVGYIDGTQVFSSSATFTFGSLTGINLGNAGASLANAVSTPAQVNQTLLFNTRLTNAQLAELTAL